MKKSDFNWILFCRDLPRNIWERISDWDSVIYENTLKGY